MKKKPFSLWNTVVWVMALLMVVSLCACSSMEEKRDKFMASGKELYEKGDYVRAALQFQNALQIDPKYAEADLWLGKTALKRRNLRGAYGALKQATELKPNLTEAQVLLGDILLLAKQLDQAQEKADLALKQEPKNVDAMMLSASIAAARSQPQKALEVLAEVHRLDPGKTSAYLMEAAILTKEKKLEEAAASLDKGLKANPKAVRLLVARASLADHQKQFDSGESFLLKAIELEPKNTELYNQLVRHYLVAGQKEKAEAALRKNVSLQPDNDKAVIMLARYLASQRRRHEAEKTIKEFIKAHPDNYAARFGLASFYISLGKPGQAEHVLEEIIKLDPDGPKGIDAKSRLARLKLAQGNLEEAEKLANAVLKANPKDIMATETRGIIALNKKDGPTATNNFRILTQDQPQNPQYWLLLAKANLVSKEEGLAKENAKKALEIKPNFIEARKFLYGMFLRAKDYNGAINTIQGYLRYNSKDVFNLISLGEVYILKGDYAQARATFQKIIDLDPKKPQGYFQQALLAIKLKKANEALQYATKALQQQPNFMPGLQLIVALYQGQHQPDKALAAVRQAVAQNPKNPQMKQLLGELLLVQKNPQGAITALEEALDLNPRQLAAMRLLALAYAKMPDPDKAVQQLEAKAANPKSSPIYSLVLASVYEHQKKFDKAINLYSSLLARNLFTDLASNNLAFLLAEYQPTPENLARAQKLASETLEDHPEEPSFLDTMGWIMIKQQKYAQAKTFLDKAEDHSPNQPAILYHLAMAEAKLGETDAARANLEKALAGKRVFQERAAAQKLLDSLPAKPQGEGKKP